MDKDYAEKTDNHQKQKTTSKKPTQTTKRMSKSDSTKNWEHGQGAPLR